MANWCSNLYNVNDYKQVSLSEGLEYIRNHEGEKLFSTGLEEDEYIIFVKNHYEYEDGCYLGRNEYELIERICGNHSAIDDCWIYKYELFVKI